MKKSRNTITISLIICSVLLLVTLQVLWLQSSLQKTFSDLQRDSNFYLRICMDEMRDSLFSANLKRVPGDSLERIETEEIKLDSLSRSVIEMQNGVGVRQNGEARSNIRVIISSKHDSLPGDVIRPLAKVIGDTKGKAGQNFVIRITNDSLSISDLRAKFRKMLVSKGMDMDFHIRVLRQPPPNGLQLILDGPTRPGKAAHNFTMADLLNDHLTLEPVGYNPMNKYLITYTDGSRLFLIKQITPELIFSLLLTLLIITAFLVIYGSMRKQQRLSELKDDFINNVTHELKTPIATVTVALEALQNFGVAEDPELTKEYVAIAMNEVTHLADITDKILKTSFLLSTPSQDARTAVDVHAILSKVVDRIRASGATVDASVTFSTAGTNFVVVGYRDQIETMLYNLFENALKYSPGKAIIEASIRSDDKSCIIEVKDYGIGIHPSYHQRIFDKFFRVPKGDVHDVKGFGLGLSYVASVVATHRGKISVQSAPGQGSTFVVVLPLNE